MSDKTVVVAMSGGVDSSVAAAILKNEGFEVVGITLQIWPSGMESAGQGCCSLDAVEDARRVAGTLGIPHYVMNLREEFEQAVIGDFIDEYARGRTPNPCVRCNERVKFRALLDRAKAIGADALATGHYARIDQDPSGRYRLLRSTNLRKDQSYVLYMLGQDALAHTVFPLGDLSKEQTRDMAKDMGLGVWKKPDSQEICFVGREGYREFVAQRRPELAREGPILDLSGREIGKHSGSIGFTLGQRKGIGIAAENPLYVVDINAEANTVVVGPADALVAQSILVGNVTWVSGDAPPGEFAVTCKVRYNMPNVPATLRQRCNGFWELVFSEPERAPTPGQAAVIYDGETVLGGGAIEEVYREGRETQK